MYIFVKIIYELITWVKRIRSERIDLPIELSDPHNADQRHAEVIQQHVEVIENKSKI